jgi:hypothetical protein
MRWNIIVECVGEDGKQSTITLGTIERLAGSTTAKNLGVNLQESKQIANRLQDTVVKQHLLHARCALLNGELGQYTRWAPSESSPIQAVAA